MADFASTNIDKFIHVSKLILRNVDWDRTVNEVKDELVKLQDTELQEFDHLFDLAFPFWKEAVLNQTKPRDLESKLEEIGVGEEEATRISELWLDEAPATLKRAKLMSASGKPQVSDIRWGLELERATRFNSPKREPLIHFKFLTDQGSENVKMNIDQLTQLHLILKDIQSHVDSVYK
ncbi:unnamed protein product [Bursaphelenchus xylophilus]|uniref:(pine wood nematode) hypothetical protein n=1 Tax=Bursaphelenchus xylophilus TaxID=6326 RepID=A0A1I7RNU9_BURXY|nr:unnamed protein product [Bursaphelenchus xylophilus]CAG9124308.1 unnamed protein product [Bursaphelenchus xylophilus]